MRIIIMGPPGSGKGTQTYLLKNYLNLNVISVGDILRNEVNKKTVLGLKIKNIIENGHLLDDYMIFSLIKNEFLLNNSFILDGMPRTLNQSILLDKFNIKFDYILNIKIDNSILIKRIKYRLINENTKNVYNVIYKKSKIKNFDDLSGQFLTLRKDDVYNVVLNRLSVYKYNLKEIIDFYNIKKNIKIFNIDGNDKIENVFLKIKSCFYEKEL